MLFLFLLSLAAFANDSPPNPYIDKGACPFECCTYREWKVEKETPLFEKIGSDKKIATLKAGTKATAVTGVVHVAPNPVDVIHDHGLYQRGEKIYLLTSEGEGFYKVWHSGKVESLEVLDLFDSLGNPKKCETPSETCWGRPHDSMQAQKRSWWIQFRLPDGQTGWTKEENNFSGNDACGG